VQVIRGEFFFRRHPGERCHVRGHQSRRRCAFNFILRPARTHEDGSSRPISWLFRHCGAKFGGFLGSGVNSERMDQMARSFATCCRHQAVATDAKSSMEIRFWQGRCVQHRGRHVGQRRRQHWGLRAVLRYSSQPDRGDPAGVCSAFNSLVRCRKMAGQSHPSFALGCPLRTFHRALRLHRSWNLHSGGSVN
jgi:hypothetical protein